MEDVAAAQQHDSAGTSEQLVAHCTLLAGRLAGSQQQCVVGGQAGTRPSGITLTAESAAGERNMSKYGLHCVALEQFGDFLRSQNVYFGWGSGWDHVMRLLYKTAAGKTFGNR